MSFENEMERVGKITAADQQVTVRLQGTMAYSTPGLVNLPTPEVYAHLGRDAKRMIHGLLDHEVAHERDTDHELFAAASSPTSAPLAERAKAEEDIEKARRHVEKRYPQVDMNHLRALGGPALKMTLNAIEDGRIETKHGARYPGASENMQQKNQWFLDKPDPRVPPPTDLYARYLLALTMVLRDCIDIDAYAAGGSYPDPEVHDMLRASRRLIMKAEEGVTTGDALAVAIDVMRLFDKESREEEEEPEPEEEEPSPSSGSSSSEPSSGDEEKGEAGDEGDEEEGDSDAEDDEEEGEDGEGDEEEGDEEEGEDGEGDEEEGDEEEDEDGDEGGAGGDEEGEDETESESGEGEGEGGGRPGSAEGEDDSDEALAGDYEMELRDWTPGGRPLTPEDAINTIIKAIFEQPDNEQPYLVFNHEYDVERDFADEDLRHDSDTWEKIKDDSRGAAEVLTQAFEVALRARREKHPVPGFDEGEVDIGMLGEFAVGSADAGEIFRQETAIDDRDCAVAVMIDCSGSMGGSLHAGSPAALARLTAAAMHEALARVQIAHEITGFTCIDSAHYSDHDWAIEPAWQDRMRSKFATLRAALVDEHKRGVTVSKYARTIYGHSRSFDPEHARLLLPFHAIFKSFAQSDARALTRVTGIHENLDGEAVLWQARRLATRPEPRRIMFVLSDGLPRGSRNSAQGARYLKEMIQRVTASGIEVYGVGIQSPHVKDFYPRSWVAKDLNELCDVAMSGMIEILTEARQEHAWVQLSA